MIWRETVVRALSVKTPNATSQWLGLLLPARPMRSVLGDVRRGRAPELYTSKTWVKNESPSSAF